MKFLDIQKLIDFELFKSQVDAKCTQFIGSSFLLFAPLFVFVINVAFANNEMRNWRNLKNNWTGKIR